MTSAGVVVGPKTTGGPRWKFRNAAARPTHLTVKDVRELVAAEYLRPIPAQSDYLATATNPVPWPTRTRPRQPRGGRPMLDAEKSLTGSKRAAALTRTAAHPF
ncbi:hypothetical protein [Plantactinospora mayteni]|uniref:hypothetical protein n=1 Tax=Plantactinospora mayteni TaxID=566021 RepID=UPI0019413F48|nr:hypothetical protein [Plantactinospora mayteni]